MKRRKGERRDDFLLRAHDAEGKRLFGERWDKANVGWGQTDDSISSKVYGRNPKVLSTSLCSNGNAVEHEVTDYRPWL